MKETDPSPEATAAELKPEAKAEPTLEAKAKTPSELTPQIIKRVHELYEELGREEVRAVQEWEKAKGEMRKDETTAEPKLEAKTAEPKPEVKAASPSPKPKQPRPNPRPRKRAQARGQSRGA